MLLHHGFHHAWEGGIRVSTTSSAAGATSRIAVIVQTGCGFLSGGRRNATLDDKEDCFGRGTVALTRVIQHTYILSPVHMAGLIGMAQVLAVFHAGFYTLRKGEIQTHCSIGTPDDATAVFEWGVDAPFVFQDRPPLAIATVAYVNHTKVLRRYRLVLANRHKLKLAVKVADAFNPSSEHHKQLRAVSFPHPIPWTSCTDMPPAIGRRYGSVRPTMGWPCLSIAIVAPRLTLYERWPTSASE